MPTSTEVTHWKIKDKAWLAQRQEDWQQVKRRLEICEKFTKRQLKIFENFYLKGKEPKWDPMYDDDPIPLLLRLWLDPDQSFEHWEAVRDKVLNYPDHFPIQKSIRATMDIFIAEANRITYSILADGVDGFMGGLEKQMFEFLMGPPGSPDVIKYKGGEFPKRLNLIVDSYFGMWKWLTTKWLQNPYKLSRYALEHWYYELTDEKCSKLQASERGEEFVMKYLKAVAHYPEPDESSEDFVRQDYCRKVRDILESRPIPDQMHEWWKTAKQAKKVDRWGID